MHGWVGVYGGSIARWKKGATAAVDRDKKILEKSDGGYGFLANGERSIQDHPKKLTATVPDSKAI
jgi:hypothetical protein